MELWWKKCRICSILICYCRDKVTLRLQSLINSEWTNTFNVYHHSRSSDCLYRSHGNIFGERFRGKNRFSLNSHANRSYVLGNDQQLCSYFKVNPLLWLTFSFICGSPCSPDCLYSCSRKNRFRNGFGRRKNQYLKEIKNTNNLKLYYFKVIDKWKCWNKFAIRIITRLKQYYLSKW